MKRILLLALTSIPFMGWAQSTHFIIKAKVGGALPNAVAYLNYKIADKTVMDTVYVKNNEFQFEGTVQEPTAAQVLLDHTGSGLENLGNNWDLVTIYLDHGTVAITAKDSLKTGVITGSEINTEHIKYKALLAASRKKIREVKAEYAATPEEKKAEVGFMEGMEARLNKAVDEMEALQYKYIKENPNSYMSLVALDEMSEANMNVAKVEPAYKSLTAALRNSAAGKRFAKQIEFSRSTSIGGMAPDFTQNDVNDKPVKLSDFRGKYVLLDFWASWCVPCRKENPNLVKAYELYKDKKFTIVGISLDHPGSKGAWLGAIKADGLTWTELADLKSSANPVATQYGVKEIPQNYLIDPSGKIIAKNLRGAVLTEKLKVLFGK